MKNLFSKMSFRSFLVTTGVLAGSFLLVSSLLVYFSGESILDRYMQDVGNASLQYYRLSLDNTLDAIGDYCADNLDDNYMVSAMVHTEDPIARQNLNDRISQSLTYLSQTFPNVYYAAVYPMDDPTMVITRSACSSLLESDNLRQEILADLPQAGSSWQWRTYNGKSYLSALFKLSDAYCAVLLSDGILSQMTAADGNFRLVCLDDKGFLSSDPKLQALLDEHPLTSSSIKLEGKRYYLVKLPSQQGPFSICALFSASSYTLSRSLLQIGVLLAVMIAVIALVMALLIRRMTLLFENLSQACQAVSQGDLDTRITRQGILTEETQIYDSFNEMTEQIKNLRIRVYEQQLQTQSSRMQSLRVQIKSHFFINCLNSIHSLAIIGDNTLIQEFTLCLTDYFRYLGSGFSETVFFGSELSHLDNYIKIHQIRYPDRITYLHSADPELEDFRILPMILQTFVENIFKHAMDMSTRITISIRARAEHRDGKKGMLLEIRDTGPGFTPEQLSVLNSPDASLPGTGIRNTKARIQLYYGDSATVTFENAADHGAVVRLFFPTFPKQEDKT